MIRKIFYISASFLMCQSAVHAHQPHDIIYALDLSPAFAVDQNLFYSTSYDIRERLLLKSTDGGRTRRSVTKGLSIDFNLSSIAISPSYRDDRTVFVAAVGDGIYQSTDGGSSWVNVSSGLVACSITRLAVSPGYMYDGILFSINQNGIIHKSFDRGRSWKGAAIKGGIAANVISLRMWNNKLEILAGCQNGILYVSSDLGESWKRLYDFSNEGSSVTAIEFSPGSSPPGELFIGTDKGGIYCSKDDGRTFIPINDGITDASITSIAVSPEYKSDGTLFCSTWYEGVFCSKNRGKSWSRASKGLVTNEQANQPYFRNPHFSALKISKSYGRDKTLFLAGYCGLFKSTDGASHWTEVETWRPKAVYGFAISPAFAQDSTLAVATQYGGAYISQDRGKSWESMNDGLALAIDRHLMDIQFSPDFSKDKTLFSISDTYSLECTLAERRWRKHGFRTNPPYTRSPFLTTITPSPKYASDRTLYAGTRFKGVYITTESGVHWRNIFANESAELSKTVSSLVLSPGFSSDRTVFAGFFGGDKETENVYKSADGGRSWKPVCSGRLSGRLRLALSPHYRKDDTLFIGGNGGLIKSMDGGNQCFDVPVSTFGGNNIVSAVGLSPAYYEDKTLIVSLKGKGLFMSTDGGGRFFQVGLNVTEAQHVPEIIQFSPQYAEDRTVYAAALEEIFMSVDGGESWSALSWADAAKQ